MLINLQCIISNWYVARTPLSGNGYTYIVTILYKFAASYTQLYSDKAYLLECEIVLTTAIFFSAASFYRHGAINVMDKFRVTGYLVISIL
ncbi:MAG: hypothetical protein ACR5K4_02560 [Sodalis sp. (in: enterobacteria)]